MPNYDFHALLEPLEFQDLVCDIIQLRDSIFLETYKEGRDSGIDGSYTDNTKKIIVQVKRYQQDFKKLYYDLQYIELPKVKKLNPDRYILGVSVDFEPKQKEEIVNLFEGYIINTRDILSSKDINRLLREPTYKRIELAYPKLWIPNLTIFEKTLKESVNRAVYKESTEELKEAIKTSKVFAPTRIYRKALHEWSRNNVIVISGEPGVGKTTMAYLLALAYLQPDNLDGFVWANSINDVYALWEDEQKQVIILDDFWGSIFHDDYTRRNDENRLDKLIKRIIEFKGNKRLILTTREYILQQGLHKHPVLKETLDRYALICTMEEYSEDEKASILFHHLYASNLDYEYVDYLFANCDWIVNHQNYNPRVLTSFLNREFDEEYSPQEYFEELCNYFDNLGPFWESIFIDLSQEAQVVAILLLISSTPMRFSDMDCCYRKYIHCCTYQVTVKSLSNTLLELEKTMIKSFYSEEDEEILLKFSMPAVQDFLYQYIEENSEQYIPLILQCCAFYNQLQFLLEHQSSKCSKKVLDLIVEQCILHYQDYSVSCLEYDGSWNWDVDTLDGPEYLQRFFNLIRCCEPSRHPALFRFLETQIKDYCLTMGEGDLEAQYTDLHNLPDIIVRCIKKGMSFNGKDIIDRYYREAFSVYHYIAMEKFQEVFPEEYGMFYKTYFPQIKKGIKNTILSELDLLEEYSMDYQLDILLDDIPDLLEKLGLRYTKKFGQKIFDVCGREPVLLSRKKNTYEDQLHDGIDQEERTLEAIKEDAENWLLGPSEIYLGNDQIIKMFTESNLDSELKEELKKVLDSGTPHYIYDFLQTKESIELLLAALCDSGCDISGPESGFYIMILWHISQGDQELMKKLVGFCAESFVMFMYREEPVLRANQFLSSEIYAYYLKNDTELYKVVHENFIIRDEQWIRFLHIPLFIFCYAFIMIMGCENKESEEFYQNLWGENFCKLKYVSRYDWKSQINIYYADIGIYYFKHYEWEGCMYRIFEELHPYNFNRIYVEPMLKSYLDKLGDGDDDSKVLKHILLCKVQIDCTAEGVLQSVSCEINDELSMIDHLSIAEDWTGFTYSIEQNKLKELQKDKLICQKDDDKWRIFLYKIEDVKLLKEIGIYNDVLKFINKIKSTYSSFLGGDYSQIKK